MNIKKFCLIYCLFLSVFHGFAQKNIFDVARSGTVTDVKTLMAINLDTINAVDSNGYCPLTLACYKGNEKVALFLASNVEDIDGNSDYGTPLMAAVYKNRPLIVKHLLKLKANPNSADVNGTTPLHYAIIFRNEEIIKLLMDANADIYFKDNRGKNAKDYAAMTQNDTIIKLINKEK
ncbi:ankyrin repeat domain-containing protein [uncultured Psychroserpens sp.]|uniref:ankyrin repeat domain-containing protein n=1 Tax=uncultured Psychroserpens sp. TaxID=255436 RepID=UPI0026321116|nr:ankyrin repeat domain-containing protein [uncultured Psychroserpens sp.]